MDKKSQEFKNLIYDLANGSLDLEHFPVAESKYVENEYEEGKLCNRLYSEMRDAYDAGDDLFNSFFGFSYQSFADLAPFLSDMLGSEMQQPQYDFEILNKEMLSSKECVLTVRISTYYDSENETVDEGEIPMVKEDGDWYISSDDFSGELGDELFY